MGTSGDELLTVFAARIEAAAGDAGVLAAIDADLAQRPEPAARKLRMRIAAQRSAYKVAAAAAARQGQASMARSQVDLPFRPPAALVAPRPVPAGPWTSLLAPWRLQSPDGRPLHRYRLDEASHADLLTRLRQRAPRGFSAAGSQTAALFVLWAAHWFQRHYRGGHRKWELLGDALGLPLDGNDGRGAELRRLCQRDAVAYTPKGFGPAADLQPADPDLAVERHGGTLVVRFQQRPARRARFRLGARTGRPLNVGAPFPLGTGIARWSGIRVRGGGSAGTAAKLTLADLADCVAFAEGDQILFGRLLDGQRQPLPGGGAHWVFRDELALRGVADDLAALLLPFADIDIWAELSFRDAGEYWHISQFEADLVIRSGRLDFIQNLTCAETLPLFGRPVDNPAIETELGQSTFSDRCNRRPPRMPEDLGGAWLLYIRRGETVIARPSIAWFGTKPPGQAKGLAAAAMIADKGRREDAMLRGLQDISAGVSGAEADMVWLTALSASLRGLPPASLDPLRLLARFPGAAARVSLHAADAQRNAVLALADGLPFAWFMVPYAVWARAADCERAGLGNKLVDVLGDAAHDLARKAVEDVALKLAVAEPLLRWPLAAAHLVAPHQLPLASNPIRPLLDAAQDHIRRHGHLVATTGRRESLFRPLLGKALPQAFDRFDAVHLESLDAPCAAAAVAAGQATLNPDAVRRIKTAIRADPIYFAEAFDARFVDLANRR